MKKTSGVDGVLPLFKDLVFELILATASQVLKGSDRQALKYKLTNVQNEYEMIRSNALANEVNNANNIVKELM